MGEFDGELGLADAAHALDGLGDDGGGGAVVEEDTGQVKEGLKTAGEQGVAAEGDAGARGEVAGVREGAGVGGWGWGVRRDEELVDDVVGRLGAVGVAGLVAIFEIIEPLDSIGLLVGINDVVVDGAHEDKVVKSVALIISLSPVIARAAITLGIDVADATGHLSAGGLDQGIGAAREGATVA